MRNGLSSFNSRQKTRWCWDAPRSTITNYGGGLASYEFTQVGSNDDAMVVKEAIMLGDENPLHSGPSVAVALHECAHILQYRAYKYDYRALEQAMDAIYPNNGRHVSTTNYAGGVEHMADCMADAMGAKMTGMIDPDIS